jgi:hypothetical protein
MASSLGAMYSLALTGTPVLFPSSFVLGPQLVRWSWKAQSGRMDPTACSDRPKLRGRPVVANSAERLLKDSIQCLKAGALDFVVFVWRGGNLWFRLQMSDHI